MSQESSDETEFEFGRRTFLRMSGAAAGAGLLGAGAAGSAAAAGDGFEARFANWRAREASKVWERGFTGRQDRAIAITDSGVAGRHPDLSPWSGIRVTGTGDSFELKRENLDADREIGPLTGTIQPGTDGTVFAGDAFPQGAATSPTDPFSLAADVDRLEGSASWTPDALGAPNDLAVYLQRKTTDEDGNTVWKRVGEKSGILANPTPFSFDLSGLPADEYRFLMQTEANFTPTDYEVSALTYTQSADTQTLTSGSSQSKQTGSYSTTGTVGPGALNSTTSQHDIELTTAQYGTEKFEANQLRVDATLSWESGADLEFVLRDPDGNNVAEGRTAQNPESLTATILEAETGTYTFEVQTYLNSGETEYNIDATVSAERVTTSVPNVPSEYADPDDKLLGWYMPDDLYGQYSKPRDLNGHGSHCSSIMAGSGRATQVADAEVDEPEAVLLPGDFLEYEVTAEAGTGVFASVYGTEVDVAIEGPDGETLATSRLFGFDSSMLDSNITDHSTVHDSGPATYTVYVKPARTRTEAGDGPRTTAKVGSVCVGSFAAPADAGSDGADADIDSLHAGMAPDAGIVGLNGLSGGQAALARDAQFWTEAFGVRTVNMSWGTAGGAPLGAVGGQTEGIAFGENPATQLRKIAEGGILTVAAAGNSFTPANGNSLPAGADDVISVVATGPLDGVVTFSSGGTGTVDEETFGGGSDDGGYDGKPDVTAPGGRAPIYPASIATAPLYDDIRAAKAGNPDRIYADDDPPRDFTLKGGTSMASPYTCGATGLLAQAMEEEAPASIALPKPADTGFEDVMRLKQVVLATASETVFTAAPYHNAKTIPHPPTYDFGDRDPYEGYGRINPDAAVDAVTRDLTDATVSESVGLNVPADSRAVAGYVEGGGTFDVSVEFSHLAGANRGMAKGAPHIDLFVYDAESPANNGEPNIVASTQATQGSGSLSFDSDGTYLVVAKLVNVPGVVNGFDVQAQFDLSVEFEPAPPDLVESATRTDDGSVFTGGQTNEVRISVDAVEGEPLYVRDTVPAGWSVDEAFSDYHHLHGADDDSKPTTVVFTAHGKGGVKRLDATYFTEAPEGAAATGEYEFGPIEVRTDSTTWTSVAGTTETNRVVGASTNL